ncbi:MAG: PAS domain S-box protein [Mucilaginibacter sp.]|uniref:PAS domain S-box protein n=1 Tax=Mucilaginibacter sp. TaxID=1882438 RepID=UPI003267697B
MKRVIDRDIRFRKLVENSHSGIALMDADMNIIYRSPSAERITGWNKANRDGRTLQDLLHPQDKQLVKQLSQQLMANSRVPITSTFRAKHFNGLYMWLDCTFTNLLTDPDVNAIVCNFRDITEQREREHHLKLLESVITNTTDAVLITEAEPFDEPGPRIVYVNDAFTKLTGYLPHEVIGKTPRLLQGPKSDKQELKRLSESLRKWRPCEVSLINYKKNGDEFWINISVSPVADDKGWYTHWISINKDITQIKNEQIKSELLSGISTVFNTGLELKQILNNALQLLIEFDDFVMAEIWLVSPDNNTINIASKYFGTSKMEAFYTESANIKTFSKGEGLPGVTWQTGTITFVSDLADSHFLRCQAAQNAGLQSLCGVPLLNNQQVIGVLILGLDTRKNHNAQYDPLLQSISNHLGSEIKRKQLEQELNQIFNFAPDIVCVAGTDGYFKKINPALCNLLEFTEQELLQKPLIAFIHPDDQETMFVEFNKLSISRETFDFETRSISKSGKVKWINWRSTPATEEGLLFCVGKDVTDKKELEQLLNKVHKLACIGGWEINLTQDVIYWSDITRQIHEADAAFIPTQQSIIAFYHDKKSSLLVVDKITQAIQTGAAFDIEVQIVTAKGNTKWVRVIGEAEFLNGTCNRIYGSFQDINALKQAQISSAKMLEERNVILESIGDAFFAVDKYWTVTYWNKMAEKVLLKTKGEMLNHNLWEIYPTSIGSVSYNKYNQAINTNQAVHFEDYYPPLNQWYDITAYPSANGLSVYFKDITERKLSEILLKESEVKYSELFHLSPIPQWVYDTDTFSFLDVNAAAIKHYGYSRNEFLSMTIKDIRPSGTLPDLQDAVTRSSNSKNSVSQGVFTHQKKNGDLIQVDILSNPVQYKGKKAKVIIANDITERLNYINAIELQYQKLREVSWMQSHVIRAPLARIMGLVPMLKDLNLSDLEQRNVLNYIITSATELDQVIKNITDLLADPEQ